MTTPQHTHPSGRITEQKCPRYKKAQNTKGQQPFPDYFTFPEKYTSFFHQFVLFRLVRVSRQVDSKSVCLPAATGISISICGTSRKDSHVSGLTRQGGRRMYVSWIAGGVNISILHRGESPCSPFSNRGVMFSKL